MSFPGKVDLVGADAEKDPSLEWHLGDALSLDERPVSAAVRKEILLAHPENARMEPAHGWIGKQKIGLLASPDPYLFSSEPDFDAHPVRD